MSDDFSDEEALAVVFSPALPEPTPCILDGEGDCLNSDLQPDLGCTCKLWCGEGSEAGCCVCRHRDIYYPCPRFGFGCDRHDPSDPDPCCTPAQQAFVIAANAYIDSHPLPVYPEETNNANS